MIHDDISINELPEGIISTYDYSYTQLKSCVVLYGNEDYPMTMISAMLSIEESQKGLMFMGKIRNSSTMHRSYYRIKVSDHTYKFKFGARDLIKSENEILHGNSESYVTYLKI